MPGRSWRSRIETSIREIVFGLEDSLVSTLGVVTGIAVGTGSTYVVILSGIVLIFVEGLSMAAGSYLSSKSAREVFESRLRQDRSRILQERVSDEESLHEMLKRKRLSKRDIEVVFDALAKERKIWLREVKRSEYRFAPAVSGSPVSSGIVMGVSYLSGGIFPLLPYFVLPVYAAIAPSILLAGLTLFALGFAKAKIAEVHWLKSGLEMTVISLTAALLGFLIARIISAAFGVQVF
ncbi:VIT1/CCC1 transporter family protein [Patescibacteria group bacterium]|nr:VIT1/CCC1 transporter family protein [Patescibacteria group bacterium]